MNIIKKISKELKKENFSLPSIRYFSQKGKYSTETGEFESNCLQGSLELYYKTILKGGGCENKSCKKEKSELVIYKEYGEIDA